MNTISWTVITFSLLIFTPAMMCTPRVQAAQPQSSSTDAAAEGTTDSNTLNAIQFETSSSSNNVFHAFGSESPTMRQMRERLRDPQQRALLRAEHRVQILDSHRDVKQVLGLDAATQEKLIELLTDQQMDQLDEFYLRSEDSAAPPHAERMVARADNETKRVQTLRELLGPEGLERYQQFSASLNERTQVVEFDDRLDPAHKLSGDQRERLIALHKEHATHELEQMRRSDVRPHASFGRLLDKLPSAEELQRQAALDTIAANEQSWRRMPKSDQLLRQRAAKFLTPPQLTTLAQMHAEKASHLQKWIEQARVQAGLSPDIPDRPEPSPALQPLRTVVAGEVRLNISLTLNRNEPTSFAHVGGNGEPVTFAIADGLFLEAKPTLYSDDTFDLQMSYYEESTTGKRLIGQSGQMGQITRAPAGPQGLNYQGSSGTVITGSKGGYAIEMSAQIEPM